MQGLATVRARTRGEGNDQRVATISGVLRAAAAAVVWTIAIITILQELGLKLGGLVAGATVVGAALGFGAQALVRDFLSGFFLLVEDQFVVGDRIDIGVASGKVERVTLRVTQLRDDEGTVLEYVPNGRIDRVANKTQGYATAMLDVGVAHGTDLDRAAAAIHDARVALVAEHTWRRWCCRGPKGPDGVQSFDSEKVVLRVLSVRVRPGSQWKLLAALRARLLEALPAAGVGLPVSTGVVASPRAAPGGGPRCPRRRPTTASRRSGSRLDRSRAAPAGMGPLRQCLDAASQRQATPAVPPLSANRYLSFRVSARTALPTTIGRRGSSEDRSDPPPLRTSPSTVRSGAPEATLDHGTRHRGRPEGRPVRRSRPSQRRRAWESRHDDDGGADRGPVPEEGGVGLGWRTHPTCGTGRARPRSAWAGPCRRWGWRGTRWPAVAAVGEADHERHGDPVVAGPGTSSGTENTGRSRRRARRPARHGVASARRCRRRPPATPAARR